MKNYNQEEEKKKKKKKSISVLSLFFFNILRYCKISEETINQRPNRKILEWKFY